MTRTALLPTLAGAAALPALLVLLLPMAARPQEVAAGADDAVADGSPVYTFGFSTGLRASDNRQLAIISPGNSYYSETNLSFGVTSETRTQSLDFRLGNRIRLGTGKGAPDNAYLLPDLDLDYTRHSRDSQLSVVSSVISRDMAIDGLPFEIIDPSELLTDEGYELRENLSVDLQTGQTAPVGTDLGVFVNNLHYIDTTDPDLYNRLTYGGHAAAVFHPDTVTEFRLGYDVSQYEADDDLRRERLSQTVALSAERELDALTSVSGRIGYKTVDETYRATDENGEDHAGIVAGLGIDRDLRTGAISAELSHDVTGAGGRSDLTVTRDFDLPAGALSLTAGVTDTEGTDLQPTGGITFSHKVNRQRLALDARTGIVISDDDVVQRASRVGVSYDFLVNPRDTIGLSLDYARSDNVGDVAATSIRRSTATAQYTRALTGDWNLTTGYSHRFRDQEDTGSAHANEVFVSLGRDFSWRP